MIKIKEGSTVVLTALQKKMLPVLSLPLPRECPTALRYALAKYDAEAVRAAYAGLCSLATVGALENA